VDPKLRYRYHDGDLERSRVGPRRELILEVRLDSAANAGLSRTVLLRFSAIDNFEEVRLFFERVAAASPSAIGFLDRIDGVAFVEKGTWRVELDHGGSLKIATSKKPQEDLVQ
jgi:hypothetical protein